MLKASRFLWTMLGALAIVTSGFAQSAQEALKSINEYRTKQLMDARQANKPLNIAELNEAVKAKAIEAIGNIDPAKVDGKDAYDWAQVFSLAGKHKEVCDLCHKYLATKPEPTQKFNAQMLMMNSCNALGEADMLVMTLKDIQPVSPATGRTLASMTANSYAPTIAKEENVDAAIKVLDEVIAKIPAEDHKAAAQRMLDAAKTREARTPPATAPKPDAERLADFELSSRSSEVAVKYAVIEKKVELLNEAGRKDEAKKILKDFAAGVDPKLPAARTINASIKRSEMIGLVAPAIVSERSYGEFKGLESLKGKVVIIDFFAHWCGPCKASYPDMRKLYDDLKPMGLEMVGVTTYYGYYGSERNLSKDAEYAKMADFIKEFNIAWPVVYGERSNFESYGVTGIPHVTVLDRKGNVHSIEIGYSPAIFKKFRAEIEKLINEK